MELSGLWFERTHCIDSISALLLLILLLQSRHHRSMQRNLELEVRLQSPLLLFGWFVSLCCYIAIRIATLMDSFCLFLCRRTMISMSWQCLQVPYSAPLILSCRLITKGYYGWGLVRERWGDRVHDKNPKCRMVIFKFQLVARISPQKEKIRRVIWETSRNTTYLTTSLLFIKSTASMCGLD